MLTSTALPAAPEASIIRSSALHLPTREQREPPPAQASGAGSPGRAWCAGRKNQSPSLPWSSPRSPGQGAHLETRLLRADDDWTMSQSAQPQRGWPFGLEQRPPDGLRWACRAACRSSAEDNVNTMPAATPRVNPQGTRVHVHVSKGSVKSLRAAVSSRL